MFQARLHAHNPFAAPGTIHQRDPGGIRSAAAQRREHVGDGETEALLSARGFGKNSGNATHKLRPFPAVDENVYYQYTETAVKPNGEFLR